MNEQKQEKEVVLEKYKVDSYRKIFPIESLKVEPESKTENNK